MEVEMNSMNTNDVWDLEEIPMEPKQQAVKGFTRQNVTPKRMWKDIKHHLQQKALRKKRNILQ